MNVFIFVYLILLGLPTLAISKDTDWISLARRLSGESEKVQRSSLVQLKKIPRLEDKLRNQLQSYEPNSAHLQTEVFLALDVISSLKLTNLFPDLLNFFDRDQSGYSIHAINSMISSQNFMQISGLYGKRLKSGKASALTKVAILDILGRMNYKLTLSELENLFENSELQVQSAILSYVRSTSLKNKKIEYQPLLKEGLASKSLSIKMQTLYLISNLKKIKSFKTEDLIADCEKDEHQKVRELCSRLETKFL